MRELKKSHSEEFLVRSYENDVRQTLRITSLFQYLQEVAGRHLADTPLGYGALKERGQFWVLVRIKARIIRMPAWRETVMVETWARKMDRMFAYREFDVRKDGELLISVSSEWMLMDRQTRKPCRLATLPQDMPLQDRQSLGGQLSRIVPEGRPVLERERTVRFSDIDMYHHVNNTKYIEWAMDCFSYGFLLEHEVEEIQINFIAEVGPDEEVVVTMIDAADDSESMKDLHYYIEGFNKTRQTKAFQMEVKLR